MTELSERTELLEQAKNLRIEVNPDWSDQYIKRVITMEKNKAEEPKEEPKERLFPVRLLKSYRPAGNFEVVGYHRKERVQKDSAGNRTVVQEASFIDGEMSPAPFPGVGFNTKVWAETVIRLPIEEARRLLNKNLAAREDALPS
jgi:hypothetical protein